MTIDYEKEAKWFITCAFDLLRRYNTKQDNAFERATYLERHLTKTYYLRITDYGKLTLVKGILWKDGIIHYKIIGHTFLNKYSQMAYVGNLLTVFLNNLEKTDNEK